MSNYEYAKTSYAKSGVDTEQAMATLRAVPVSLHCWQGQYVRGIEPYVKSQAPQSPARHGREKAHQ